MQHERSQALTTTPSEAGVQAGPASATTEPALTDEPRPAHAHDVSLDGFRERSLSRGVNPFVYWTLRAILVPAFVVYCRMQRIGREHLPRRVHCCSPPTTAASSTRS